MYLVLGSHHDPLAAAVVTALVARGCEARIVASPFDEGIRFAWRLETETSRSSLRFEDGVRLDDDDVEGVFVGAIGAIDPDGWEPADVAYVHTETHAALLGWLWSLSCPVVNRPRADTWYRPSPPLVSWHGSLARSGLPTMETLITNSADAARAFARRRISNGPEALIFGPLTSEVRYLVAEERDWDGLRSLQGRTPVPLADPHGAPQFACVSGDDVVWEPSGLPAPARFEPALRTFAAEAGLELVEVVFAPVRDGLVVIGVEPRPNLAHFGDDARARIVDGIVGFLTAGPDRPVGQRPAEAAR